MLFWTITVILLVLWSRLGRVNRPWALGPHPAVARHRELIFAGFAAAAARYGLTTFSGGVGGWVGLAPRSAAFFIPRLLGGRRRGAQRGISVHVRAARIYRPAGFDASSTASVSKESMEGSARLEAAAHLFPGHRRKTVGRSRARTSSADGSLGIVLSSNPPAYLAAPALFIVDHHRGVLPGELFRHRSRERLVSSYVARVWSGR